MVADRVTGAAGFRGRAAAALAAVAAASPLAAFAQSIEFVESSFVDGSLVHLEVGLGAIGLSVVRVEVALGPEYELVAADDDAGRTYLTSDTIETLCGFVGVYRFCSLPGAIGLTLDAGAHPTAGEIVQRVVFTGAEGGPWPATFRLTLRLRLSPPPDPCWEPESRFELSGGGSSVASPASSDICAARQIPARVVLRPAGGAPAVARRAAPAEPVVLELLADVGSLVPVNEVLSDPAVLAQRLQCRRAGDPAFGACANPAGFGAFMTVAAYSDSPARVVLTAVDGGDPLPGDAEIRAELGGVGTASGTLLVTVEQDATAVTLAASPSAAVTQANTAVTLEVVEVLNARGGHEPRSVSWALDSVEPAAQDALGRSWFQAASGRVAVGALPAEPVRLRLRADHANRTAGVTSGRIEVTVAQAPPSCSIVAAPSRVGPGAVAELRVQSTSPAPFAGDLGASWTVDSGGGVVAGDAVAPWRASFTAPAEPGTARARVELTGAAWPTFCEQSSLALDLAIEADVGVRLAVDKGRVEPGRLARGRATLSNLTGSPVGGLVLRLDLPPMLAAVAAPPRVTAGVALAPLARERAALTYAVDLDAAPERALDLTWLVRAGFGCGKARVRASLQRGGDGPTIAAADATVEVLCEPELSEATVFGRVFADTNGNGVQDSGEEGLPGALVASAAGVWAVTDASGSYHLNRLAPGRHAIKLDVTSLAPGSELGTARRDVTLTPGAFVRASFAVRPPRLELERALTLVPRASGVRAGNGRLVYRARLRLPHAGELVAQRGDELIRARDEGSGEVTLDVPIEGDGEHWVLVLRAPGGQTWLWSFATHVYSQGGGGRLVVPWGPRALAGLLLPSASAANGGRLSIAGELRAAGRITIAAVKGGPVCILAEQGRRLHCELQAMGEVTRFYVVVDPALDDGGDDPPPLALSLELPRATERQFLVARGTMELGGLATGAEPRWDGGAGFFYRGLLGGGALVTAGADLPGRDLLADEDGGRRSWGSVTSRLLGHDPRRVFRDLDPEAYYPTYGDDATVVDEREAGGRLFARVEAGRSFAKWGGVNTAITDAEYGQYVRSLYGFGAKLEGDNLGGAAGAHAVGLRAVVFAARPDTVAASDELLVTGGSLYFLARRDLVEGSLRASLELLDDVSGLPVRVVPLVEGVDYEADYLGGRITLDPALPQRAFSRSLTATDGGGAAARLIVSYEYYAGANLDRDLSGGGRVVLRLGPVSLGGTAVGELSGPIARAASDRPRYRLLGATARLDLGHALRLRLDFAHSDGSSHATARSWDGGQSFTDAGARVARPAGAAAALEVTSALGPLDAGVYARVTDPGFGDSRTAAGRERRQLGARLSVTPLRSLRLWAQADHREERPEDAALERRYVAVAGAAQRLGAADIGLEGRYEAMEPAARRRISAGAELGVRPWSRWRMSVRRRQVLDEQGPRDGEGATAVGAQYTAAGGPTMGAELGMTDDGRAFGRLLGRLPVAEGSELYAAYVAGAQLDRAAAAADDDHLLVGGRRRLDDGSSLYSEQRLALDGGERRVSRAIGAETALTRRLGLVLAYERGTRGEEGRTPTLVRDSGSVGAVYHGQAWSLRLGSDGRHDDGPAGRILQLGGQGRLELRLADGLTLAAGGRGASTYGVAGGALAPGRQVWEASAGFALRPWTSERLSVFGRYAVTVERSPAAAAEPRTRELSHIGTAAIVFAVAPPLDLGPKVYYRRTALRYGAETMSDRAVLAALRADWHVGSGFDASAEGRACAAPGSDASRRYGGLVEASALVLEWLRLGAGYNLSDVATQGVRCDEPGARGLFVRAEAVY